jgi:hypothetical protein
VNYKLLALAVGIVGALPFVAHGEDSRSLFDTGKRLWSLGDYRAAYVFLKRVRESDFGRSFELDFMLGTSACRLSELRERGARFLLWILYTYSDKLTKEGRDVVQTERIRCANSTLNAEYPTVPDAVNSTATAISRYSGKTFYFGDRSLPLIAYPTKKNIIPASVIQQRTIPIGHSAEAIRQAKLAAPKSRVLVSNRFVIASQSKHTEGQLRQASSMLEWTMDFFIGKFQMRPPKHYIHVFLVPSMENFARFSWRYHGLKLSVETIAYSSSEDLSIVAIIPRLIYGSVFHELFHLLARPNFGDIPAWLDEGIAALYESPRKEDNDLKGVVNWRGNVLTNFGSVLPSDLIRHLGRGINAIGGEDNTSETIVGTLDVVQEAKFAASARYFAMYLQEKGLLASTYLAVRDLISTDDFSGQVDYLVREVEKSTGLSFDALDNDFEKWLEVLHPRSPDSEFN